VFGSRTATRDWDDCSCGGYTSGICPRIRTEQGESNKESGVGFVSLALWKALVFGQNVNTVKFGASGMAVVRIQILSYCNIKVPSVLSSAAFANHHLQKAAVYIVSIQPFGNVVSLF